MANEIKNKAFRKAMEANGLADIQLIKADGYFYISGGNTYQLEDCDIYLNSFGQQSIEGWIEDIKHLLKNVKEIYL